MWFLPICKFDVLLPFSTAGLEHPELAQEGRKAEQLITAESELYLQDALNQVLLVKPYWKVLIA